MLNDLEPLAREPAIYVFVVVLGLLWGSFANVCIYRWPPSDEFPNGRSVIAPGSHCFACKAPIRWYDNVPLLAWLWLRGKCRACQAPFSARYLIVEALTGLLFGVAWWLAVVVPSWFAPFVDPFAIRLAHFAVYASFSFVLVVITFIDIDHMLILNKVTLPSIVIFYAASFLLPDRHWYDGLVGAAVGYGLPWAIGEIYFRITRRDGLGLGDSTLLALVGALFGWPGVLVSLFGGSMIGAVIGISAVLVGRAGNDAGAETGADPSVAAASTAETVDSAADGSASSGTVGDTPSLLRTELPFGPFLATAALLYMFAEPWIQLHFHLPGG